MVAAGGGRGSGDRVSISSWSEKWRRRVDGMPRRRRRSTSIDARVLLSSSPSSSILWTTKVERGRERQREEEEEEKSIDEASPRGYVELNYGSVLPVSLSLPPTFVPILSLYLYLFLFLYRYPSLSLSVRNPQGAIFFRVR